MILPATTSSISKLLMWLWVIGFMNLTILEKIMGYNNKTMPKKFRAGKFTNDLSIKK